MSGRWDAVIQAITAAGVPALANAIAPGSPVVGQAAGLIASDLLQKHLGEDPRAVVVQSTVAPGGKQIPAEQPPHLHEAIRRTDAHIREHGGYDEVVFPKNFTMRELADKHSGRFEPPDVGVYNTFLAYLQQLRERYGKPMHVNSGWRGLDHPEEAKKGPDAAHPHYHCAVDVSCHAGEQRALIALAASHREDGSFVLPVDAPDSGGKRFVWRGLGDSARGPMGHRFLHLDMIPGPLRHWGY